jgi:hypothetical protein
MTAPNYSADDERVTRLVNRLQAMRKATSGSDPYNQGIRDGIHTAALAVTEELNTNLRQTLAGPPTGAPTPLEILATLRAEDFEQISKAADFHGVTLCGLLDALDCEHSFDAPSPGPDGELSLGDCLSCGIPGDFLSDVGWDLGEVACGFCSDDMPICAECGKGWE